MCFVSSRLAISLITNPFFSARHTLVVANLVVVVVVEYVVLVVIYQSVCVKLSYAPMVVKLCLRRFRRRRWLFSLTLEREMIRPLVDAQQQRSWGWLSGANGVLLQFAPSSSSSAPLTNRKTKTANPISHF